MTDISIRSTVCMWCHSHCKVAAHVEDGRLARLEADPNHPRGRWTVPAVRACPRARAAAEWFYHKERLCYPLKRSGGRGENRWKPVAWDQALDEIADVLGRLRYESGAETLASTSGTYRTPDEYRRRFFYLYGSLNLASQGHICWGVSNMVSAALCGLSLNAVTCVPGKTACVLLIGSNPGQAERASWHLLIETRRAGAKLIVVDPRLTECAKVADVWIRPRPGTDGMLLLGMMRVIIEERLYDAEFVEKHCHGFDRLRERVKEYNPALAAEVCRVPAEQIVEAARMYATCKPANLQSYLGVDQGSNAVQALHARYLLPALTGNIDVPGGDLGRPPTGEYIGEREIELYDLVKPEQKAKQIGAERFKLLSHVGYDLVQESVRRVWGRGMTSSHHCFAHAPLLFRAILSGQPYPVRAMVTAANNPLLTYANAHLVFDALCKLDLYVVLDSWMTPSAQLADYVLPTASWLERPCLFSGSDTAGFLIGGEAAVPNVVPGQYERRTDYDVWKGLGERLGQVGYWPWKTLEEAYNHRLGPVGLTLKGFADRGGHWRVRESYRPYAEVGFATPTGKFELCSTVFEKLGFDPLPRYVEPVESPVSTPELARRYPLILMTGARFNVHYHSEHRQVRTLRIQHAEPVVQMHPGTAEEWDVQDGAWIWVETRRGKVRMRLRTTHAILPGVVHAQHGWWFPEMPGEKPGLHGVWESNVNVLTDDDPSQCNEMSGGWPLRSLLCRVSKVEESPTAEPV